MRARLDVGRGKKVRSECTAMYRDEIYSLYVVW